MSSKDEIACVYASLILMDDDVPITAEKISTILKAAGVSVEPYWPGLFAKASAGLDLKSLVTNIGSGVASGAAVGGGGGSPPAAAAASTAAAPAEKKEEKKEEPEEESDEDMGFGLFD